MSSMGRVANFMSRRFPHLVAKGTHKQVAQFKESNGAKGNKMFGKSVFLLETVGRKSGEPRPVMLMLARRGDDLIVVGSNGGNPVTPNWYKNLLAAEKTEVQVGPDRWWTKPPPGRRRRVRRVLGDRRQGLPRLRHLPATHRPQDPRRRPRALRGGTRDRMIELSSPLWLCRNRPVAVAPC